MVNLPSSDQGRDKRAAAKAAKPEVAEEPQAVEEKAEVEEEKPLAKKRRRKPNFNE